MSQKISRLIQRAIKLAGGTEQSLALKLHLSQPLIHNCKKKGRCGPILAMRIHQFSHGEISGSELRPDLWRKPEDVPTADDDVPTAPDDVPCRGGAKSRQREPEEAA